MNSTLASPLARLFAVVVAMIAALPAVAQEDEGRGRPSSRERRLGIPGGRAPGATPPVIPGPSPAPGASVPEAAPKPVPGAASAPATEAPVAVPGPAPVPRAQPAVPSPAPVGPARSDAPSGWPKVVVTGGIFSPNRAHRVVIINGAPAREGAEPVPGVLVEQVRADRVVLSYRGQRHTVMY